MDVRTHAAAAWPWIGLAARLLVGIVWIVAGYLKLVEPAASVRAVRAYQLLPDSLESPVGYGLPVLEICVGALLVLGLVQRVAAVVSAVLFCLFIIGISQAWGRGLQIDCGCFGGGGTVEGDVTGKYVTEIARDAGLLILSLALTWRPRTALAADTVLFPERTYDTDADLTEDDADDERVGRG